MSTAPRAISVLVLTALTGLAACSKQEPATGQSGDSTSAPVATAEPVPAPAVPEAASPAPAEVVTAAADTAPVPTEATIPTPPPSETAAPAPASETTIAVAEPAATPKPIDGGQIAQGICMACHQAGMNGAPKMGNKVAWEPRIAQGREKLYEHAIKGLRGMPPRGGNPALSDDQIKAATDYMVKLAGGYKE